MLHTLRQASSTYYSSLTL